MSQRVLVTGGMGYLGGRIVNSLANDLDTTIRVLSEPSDLTNDENVETVVGNLLEENDLIKACENIDTIVHLAAMNEVACTSNPNQALLVNTLGTLHLLRAAEFAAVKRIIYFSTAHIYGSPLQGSISEETLPRPVHPYAITHKAAEDYVLAAHDNEKLTGIVVRLSNAIGSPQRPNVDRWMLASNDFCRQSIEKKQIILRSPGSQHRDFIALKDVSRAVLHLLTMEETSLGNSVFNLGGERTISIKELALITADRCQETLGFLPEVIIPTSEKLDIVPELKYSIDKLKSTGFVNRHTIEEEIDATLVFCQHFFGS